MKQKTRRDEVEEAGKAFQALKNEIYKAVYMPQIVEWLCRQLKNEKI